VRYERVFHRAGTHTGRAHPLQFDYTKLHRTLVIAVGLSAQVRDLGPRHIAVNPVVEPKTAFP
jgi:hypothetical protein